MQRYIIFLYKKNNYSFLTYRNFTYPQNMFFPPPQKKSTFGQRPKPPPSTGKANHCKLLRIKAISKN
jgi:hypothetical protein